MTTAQTRKVLDIGLGLVFVLGIAFTTFMLITSWGGASWVFGSAVSIVVGGLAMLRERQRLLTAIAGIAVTGIAVAVSLSAADDLPREPAPITALALSVLVGSAIRTLPIRPAAGVAAGGLVIVGATWFDSFSTVTVLATMGMIAALVLGPLLRGLDRTRRTKAPQPGLAEQGGTVAGASVT
ncbi:hypothetical protein GCM10009789_64250 [Kribbella sancticallisti]|uniref:Metal transporter n=1 Tax=Kribbella sancticallisti TaxID=460087 RepID=A0ABN2EA89_9ACTN